MLNNYTKKINFYLKKSKSTYVIYSILFFIILFRAMKYLDIIKDSSKFSIFDFIIYIMDDVFLNIYLFPILILVLAYKLDNNLDFEKYIMVRFKSRNYWFLYKIKSIAIKSFIFFCNILVVILLVNTIYSYLNHEWSESIIYSIKPLIGFEKHNPTMIIFLKFTLTFLYIFTINLLFVSISNLLKDYSLGLFISMIINAISAMLFINKPFYLKRFIFAYNILLDNSMILNSYISILYWLVLIGVIIDVTMSIITNYDY